MGVHLITIYYTVLRYYNRGPIWICHNTGFNNTLYCTWLETSWCCSSSIDSYTINCTYWQVTMLRIMKVTNWLYEWMHMSLAFVSMSLSFVFLYATVSWHLHCFQATVAPIEVYLQHWKWPGPKEDSLWWEKCCVTTLACVTREPRGILLWNWDL